MLASAKQSGQMGRGGAFNKANVENDDIHQLTDIGISRDLSSRARAAGSLKANPS
jgi:hypothetical protein